MSERPGLPHVGLAMGGAIVLAWLALHPLLFGLALGGLTGYGLGHRHGRRSAVVKLADEVTRAAARRIGRGY